MLGRPRSPDSAWCASTLASLKATRRGDLGGSYDDGPSSAFEPTQGPAEPWQVDMMKSQAQSRSRRNSLSQDSEANSQKQEAKKQPKKQGFELVQSLLPDADLVLERLRGGSTGFSESELDRVKATFLRFKVPDSQEVHKDELLHVLSHLGYTQLKKAAVSKLANEVTDYSTLELPDFISFVETYAKHEHEKFSELFASFDDDGNGELDQEELVRFLTSLGFTPLRKMLREAYEMVDSDNSGTLSFEEVVLLLHVYRHSEGFTHDEIHSLTQIFNREKTSAGMRDGDYIPATQLASFLMQFFGPVCADQAKKLEEEAKGAGRQQAPDDDDEEKEECPGMPFSEALLWSRRLRDYQFGLYRKAFHDFDDDGSGSIDLEELKSAIKSCGYTLSQASIDELIQTAKDRGEWKSHQEGDCEMDFDEFVHVMQILHESDGFNRREMKELNDCFDRFDEDKSGDMDVIELSDLLHYMGHDTKLDQVYLLVAKVDYNNSGTLHFREFLRLMRLHREEELESVREVFEEYEENGKLSKNRVVKAMNQLAVDEDERNNQVPALVADGRELNFDGFVEIVDKLREVRVRELRKRAGFNEVEVARFHTLFDRHDHKKEGYLGITEVTKFLQDLGFTFNTVAEQQEIVAHLQRSREAAAERGVVDPSPSKYGFWVMIQLLRALYRRDDRQAVNRVARASDQCQFSVLEVDQFREVFMNWFEKDSVYEDPELQAQRALDDPTDDKKELTKASIRRLLRSLGVQPAASDREKLDLKVVELNEQERLDFADFLRLMRWMMDINFGNINGTAEKHGR